MKKNVFLTLCVITMLVLAAYPSFAQKTFPEKEISGVIENVKVGIPESIWTSGYTTIEFKDGRIVTFNGVYTGLVFEKGKECTITYRHDDRPFAQGTYIIHIKYGK